jgi:hypothetical protein
VPGGPLSAVKRLGQRGHESAAEQAGPQGSDTNEHAREKGVERG